MKRFTDIVARLLQEGHTRSQGSAKGFPHSRTQNQADAAHRGMISGFAKILANPSPVEETLLRSHVGPTIIKAMQTHAEAYARARFEHAVPSQLALATVARNSLRSFDDDDGGAGQGDQGNQGDQGDQGNQGDQGDQGNQGGPVQGDGGVFDSNDIGRAVGIAMAGLAAIAFFEVAAIVAGEEVLAAATDDSYQYADVAHAALPPSAGGISAVKLGNTSPLRAGREVGASIDSLIGVRKSLLTGIKEG